MICSVPEQRETRMNWFKRKRKEEPVPGSTEENVEIPLGPDCLELTHLINMTNNVMWCRENLDAMLNYVGEHRADGHDCPPFCLPRGIAAFLNRLNKNDVIMLLLVLMKDLDASYVFEEPEA